MTNPNIRNLVKMVHQDPEKETIDTTKTAKSLNEVINLDILKVGRLGIIEFLMQIWFHGAHNFSTEFWWEMHYRIMKLLHVSMVLEARNLKSFGVKTAEMCDIPQPLIFLHDYIVNECTPERFSKVKDLFESKCKGNKEWTDLYLKSF